jgi:DeoR family ulaG and ulaABCDEF operon transcriptional repressor
MFLGAAAINRHGLMQSDIILVQAERKLLALADQLIALMDASKFENSAAHLLCELPRLHTVITDSRITDTSAKMVTDNGVELVVVDC